MFNPDLPIKDSNEDMLNRGSFAESLADTIIQYSFSSSFTIGLYGKWGSGKTSLLNMVLENVERSDKDTIILRFNPWLCTDSKQIITQFFKQMANAIKLKKPKKDHAWDLIDQYADIFDMASLIPVAGSIAAVGGKILAKKAKKHTDQVTNDLQRRKNEIIEKMKKENLKIIVSIDDIDRLSEEEIIVVFQLVKALADFPNTIYLLVFDYDVVVRALSNIQHGDGKEYLEKIVQVPFEIPAPDMTSIHNTFFTKLDTILGNIPKDKWDETTWSLLFLFGIKGYIMSIRDVIRYINVLSLKYQLLKDETDLIDLLGLTCLQVFEPYIYSILPNYKDILCNSSYEQLKGITEKMQKTFETIISDRETVVNASAAKTILGIIFPQFKSFVKLSYNSFGRNYNQCSLINKNIAVSACFDRYFSLTLENDAIPSFTVNQLIYKANESDFAYGVNKIYQEGKLTRLLDEIEGYRKESNSSAIPSQRAALIIKCLSRQWHTFKNEEIGLYSIPFDWRLLFCVDTLLQFINLDSRYFYISDIFADINVDLSTLSLILDYFEHQHGRFTDKEANENNQLLALNQVLELEDIFKKRAKEALTSSSAFNQHDRLDFLLMLKQLDSDFVMSKMETIIKDDISLVKVIGYCISNGTMHGQSSIKTLNFHKKHLEEFIDVSQAYQRIHKFVETASFLSLSRDDQMNTVAFLLNENKQAGGNIMDNCISEEVVRKELYRLIDK